jgi:putative transposase
MARPLRIEFADALYHVTSRGNERRLIFRNDSDRIAFLAFLAEAVKRFGWSLTAWVLMTNHYHLVIQTPEPNLSRGMHWLNSRYAGWFNHRHKRSGHLFEGRFKSFLIEKEEYFSEVLRYVVLNPVRARMVARPEAYRWSSYRATAGLDEAPEWLDVGAVHGLFEDDRTTAESIYGEFVLARIDSQERLWDQVTGGIYLGRPEWTRMMRKQVESRPRSTDHPKKQRAIGRPKTYQIIEAVSAAAGTEPSVIRGMRGNPLRSLVAWLAWHEGLVTLRSIAASLRLRSEGHVSNLIRRCEQEFSRTTPLLGYLDAALAALRG